MTDVTETINIISTITTDSAFNDELEQTDNNITNVLGNNHFTTITCSICAYEFTRMAYLKKHLQTKRHIEKVKFARDKKQNTGLQQPEALNNANSDAMHNDDQANSNAEEDGEEEDSVVPNQIYPALLQKRAMALYKKEMSARRQQAAAKIEGLGQQEQHGKSENISDTPSDDTKSCMVYQCGGCGKQLANKSNLNRHERNCTEAIELKDKLFTKHKTQNQNHKPDKAHKPLGNITININIDNSKNTNTNNTQNIWNHLSVNPFGYEDISILQNKQVINKIHGRGMNAFDELLHQIYSLPSNRNIAITNQRKNLAKYINSKGEVKITDQERLLNDLVMNHIDILDEFLAKTITEIEPQYKRTIDTLMKQHDLEDNPNIARYISFAYFLMLNITEDGLKNIGKFKKTVDEYITKNLLPAANSDSDTVTNSDKLAGLPGLFKLPQSIRRINP